MSRPANTSHSSLSVPLALFLLSCFFAANVRAVSLDDAVNAQLENLPGVGPCGRLLNAGGVPTGNLETICARAVPVGSTPSSTGGGSATPAATPNVSSSVADDWRETGGEAVSIAGPWSLFLTAENESLDRKASGTEGAFDSGLNRVVVGGSFSPSTRAALSLALDMSQHEGDFRNGGDFSYDSRGLRLLGEFNPAPPFSLVVLGFYDDVSAERQRVARFDDSIRVDDSINEVSIFSVEGTPETGYDYGQLGMTIQGAYELTAGQLSVSPQLGLDWINSDYGTYNERGDSGLELTFHDDKRTSLQSALGLQATYAVGTSFGAVIPQLGFTWRHEFEDDARNVTVSFVEDANATRFQYQTDTSDSDFFEVSAGSVWVLKNGVQMFVHVQTLVAHQVYDSLTASAGVRVEL